jgi:NifU-like protein involved in Fe-S cluster formation/TusA-related sulfurtransferase
MFTYSQKALDHFKNPRNVGKLIDPDGVGEVGSLACGQMLRLMFKLDETQEKIVKVTFQAFGCASAIAACSALTEILQGKTLDEAQAVSKEDVIDYLEGLPEQREFCSDISIEAVHLAIKDCRIKQKTAPKTTISVPILDCRVLACPLNYVKTKIMLDQMQPGARLCVLLGQEGARNVPISAKAEGHTVLEVTPEDDYWRVVILKGS